MDTVFFFWGFRLIALVLGTEDVLDLHLHLKATESAKIVAEHLEETWRKEMLATAARRANLQNAGKPEAEIRACQPQLWRALQRTFGRSYYLLGIWKLFWSLFIWLGSYGILKWLLIFCQERNDGTQPMQWRGHLYALALFASAIMSSICFHQCSMQSTKIGIRCRAALMVLIYRKSLRLSYVKGGVGDVVNLIANECNRVAEATINWHFLWSSFADAIIVVILVFMNVGLAAGIPALVLILFILLPLQYYLANAASKISLLSTAHVTKRVHLVSEVLTAIKLLKFYAWESFYVDKIMAAREIEIKELRASLVLRIASYMVVFMAPACVMLACLAVYLHFDSADLSASTIFVLFSLFNTLRYPLVTLPRSVRTVNAASTSLHRLEEFLNLPEVDELVSKPLEESSDALIDIKNADFVWDGDLDHPHINNLSLQIKRGEIIAVVGDLSSGKSLLAAIMGQIKRISGEMESYGRCGYVPQEPWLIDANIRDNILFGNDFDDQKYTETIRIVGLTRDLMLMSNGDESRISDLNLTPSQKQRMSLARCLYHDCDVILVEDCLSDFEAATAKRLFKEVFRNNLVKTKAIVLVTQQKQFLSECDRILVLKNGNVIEEGTYTDLKAKKVNFSAWVNDYIAIDDDPQGLLDQVSEIRLDASSQGTIRGPSALSHFANRLGADISSTKPRSPFGRLGIVHKPSPLSTAAVISSDMELSIINGSIEEANEMTIKAIMELNNASVQNTQINEQTISKMIERNQLSVLTGGPSRPPANFSNQDPVTKTIESNQLTVHSMVGFERTMSANGIALRSEAGPWQSYIFYLNEGNGLIVGSIFLAFFFVVHAVFFVSDWWLAEIVQAGPSQTYTISIGVYGGLIALAILGLLLRGVFFAIGVVRKSKSLHDKALRAIIRAPMSFFDLTPLGQILSNFAKHLYLIDDSLPESLFQVLTILPLLIGILILVSAIVPIFVATLPIIFGLGFWIIRLCHDAETKLVTLEGVIFMSSYVSLDNINIDYLAASNKAPMFSHLSTTLEGLFSIRLYQAQDSFDTFNRGLIDADHKALYSLNCVKTVQAMYLDFIAALTIYFAALFVVVKTDIPAPLAGLAVANAVTSVGAVVHFSNQMPMEAVRHVPSNRKRPYWPENGAVEFKNVTLRYQSYGVAILKSVSFRIGAGEKIGVVGRSGSGKSTLLVALLRITEYTDGDILIDGVDIKTLGVADLRSRIAVIPQDPVLLTGTIRSNLDPFNKRQDTEIWDALRSVHLAQKIEEFPLKLETPIVENGRSFSLAERQLFCIARAILLKTKIVVFDEPTVAADSETDSLIQSTISENFMDSTVIILASRFRMMAETDRVLVMKDGRIVEFDTPLALLNNPKSKFSLMLNQAADFDQEKLRRLAVARVERKKADKKANKPVNERRITFGSRSPSVAGSVLDAAEVRMDAIARGSSSPTNSTNSGENAAPLKVAQMPKSLLDIFNKN
ncbi:P-loop containing nucleoside triphosphate hydrolase protein [Chytriomyces sp. MP71]|nr:P-loop containing nucleoside triphosphate hydrolase protein [Chytriomyces sp. MP71]